MKKEEFSQIVKKKSTGALLQLLDSGQSGRLNIDSDLLNVIIEELNSRELSEEEMKMFLLTLNLNKEEHDEEEQKDSMEFTKDELARIVKPFSLKGREKRNSSLKNISDQISNYADYLMVLAIGCFAQVTFFSEIPYGFLYGFLILFGCYISRLFILALSKLIMVWMEIELNTRK